MKILADAMGLGKTIMTISLLATHSERGGLSDSQSSDQPSYQGCEAIDVVGQSPNSVKSATKFPGFDKLSKQRNKLANGGNLIICPMTLLGQWKVCLFSFKVDSVHGFAYSSICMFGT